MRINSDSRNEAVEKLQQVPVISWLLTVEQSTRWASLNSYWANTDIELNTNAATITRRE
jgi:hypothetical protein